MPHILIEYSETSPIADGVETLLSTVEAAATSTDLVPLPNLKIRARGFETYRVAGENAPFIHVNVAVREGAAQALKEEASAAILDAVCELFPSVESVTVDIRDMNRGAYAKKGGFPA
ncbi:MAG: hypothetical protein AAF527_07005 [Pseudomonadota bacterium]